MRIGEIILALDALVSIGQALAQEGPANLECHAPGIVETDVVASSLQFATCPNATKDDGARKKLRAAGKLVSMLNV
jgi:hypothetical protein